MTPAEKRRLRRATRTLHDWFQSRARDLPWRRTRDPYAIWVSEVMLQQTQVATVIPYFGRWMAALPTVGALAEASEEEVLRLWEGLGYYGRARNLHRAARILVEHFSGAIPADTEAFRSLPGVGPYTAAAVMSFAYDLDRAVLDGNVRRVLSRLFAMVDPDEGHVAALAQDLLPEGTAAVHNQAIMELGALVCTPRTPRCTDCPLKRPCAARASGEPARFSPKRQRGEVPHRQLGVGLVLHGDRIFIHRRPSRGLLGGLWEFPRVSLSDAAHTTRPLRRELKRSLKRELGLGVRVQAPLPLVRHAYSHFKVTLHPCLCSLLEQVPTEKQAWPARWIKVPALARHPMSSADRNIMRRLIEALAGG